MCTNGSAASDAKGILRTGYCVLSETAHSQPWAYGRVPNSACASAISGICDVGATPSSAGARTAWASVGRPVA